MEYLRDLALFVAVADARSFSGAGARLGIPTSTVSRRIAELETAVGFKLFRRDTRRVELTEAGALYRARCDAIVEAAAEALEHVRDRMDAPRGVLRLSVEAEIGPRFVGPAIAAFTERYPEMRVEVDLSPRRVDLVAEGFDLAVRLGRLPASGLIARRLAWLETGLFASAGYVARYGAPEAPAALRGHRRIHMLHEGDRGDWVLRKDNEQVEIEADGVVSTDNMAMVRTLVRQGVGIAAVDRLVATEDVERGELVAVLAEWRLPRYPVTLLTVDRALPARARLFIDVLTQHTSRLPGMRQE